MENYNDLKIKVITSLFWKLAEKMGDQGVQFIVGIVIARLLLPEDFGIIALTMVFINISIVIIETGFNSALIQKKEVDSLDYNSVFYLTLLMSIIIYLFLFLLAPMVARFYNEPLIIPVLRVLSLVVIIGSFNSVQRAILYRNMLFKKFFKKSFMSITISGLIGFYLAYKGYGVWALVAQQISHKILLGISMWFTVDWSPSLSFSHKRLKPLIKYSGNILGYRLLNTINNQLRSLIIGKIYTFDMLAYYNRGHQFPATLATNTDYALQGVMLTAYSKVQDNPALLKSMMRRTIKSSSFFLMPAMFGLAAIAHPLVNLILTEKWLPSVQYIQVFCIVYGLQPIRTANLQALNGMGRSDIYFKLGLISKLISIIAMLITVWISPFAVAIGAAIASIISTLINIIPNSKLLKYSFKEQLMDIIPSLIMSSIMFLIVHVISFINLPMFYVLIIQVFVGIFVYIFVSWMFKVESLTYFINLIKKYINVKKNSWEEKPKI